MKYFERSPYKTWNFNFRPTYKHIVYFIWFIYACEFHVI